MGDQLFSGTIFWLGSAQTRQGFALHLPPFCKKAGEKLSLRCAPLEIGSLSIESSFSVPYIFWIC
ncbi:MAG: hypothetical protein HFF17_00450 [Oscillospiraceae bacterium]|nr:hypothetical protein [Oscillospiraceae bacterium]